MTQLVLILATRIKIRVQLYVVFSARHVEGLKRLVDVVETFVRMSIFETQIG